MKLLLIDNYDSFVYNLKQMFSELGAECLVRRNDAIDLAQIKELDPDMVVLSPGPGHPINQRDFGVCKEVLMEVSPHVPTLGVCLGHQGIAVCYGAKVSHCPVPVHGKTSLIEHEGKDLFTGLESPLTVGRYHSLIVQETSEDIEITARTLAGEIMAIRHRRYPIHGVQFHPESVLTPKGKDVVANFMRISR